MISFLPRRHKNLLFLLLGLVFAAFCVKNPDFYAFLRTFSKLGFLGAFLSGILFVSTFTLATGAIILVDLSRILPPVLVILPAVFGAVIGDLFLFFFVKKGVVEEVSPIYEKITGHHFKKILHTKYFAWTLPVLGALVIISPLPDELGISLLGLSEIKINNLVLLSFFSHGIGMSLIYVVSRLV